MIGNIYDMKLNDRLDFDHGTYIRVPNGWVFVVSHGDIITSTFIPMNHEFNPASDAPF